MRISVARSEAFLRSPGSEVRAVLLYGPNAGLVHERADRLAAAIAPPGDPFRTSELSPDDLKNDPARLNDEAQALSLGGGRRVVRLRGATDAVAKAFEGWLDGASGDSLMVVEAGDLSPRSTLRKLFEGAACGAAVPCYADEGRSAEEIVGAILESHGLAIERSALDRLLGALGDDRLVIRSEVEKLALYARGKGRLGVEDVEAAIGDSGEMSLEAVALAAASGDGEALERALARAYRAGAEPVSLLRAAAGHLQRLHLIAGQTAEGTPEEAALDALRPPIFFKTAPAFRRQLRLWDAARLMDALKLLAEAEKACKTTGNPAETLCARALLGIAVQARPGRA